MALPNIPERYLLPVSRTDWPELLSDWRSLLPEGSTPWLLTKFGELFVVEHDEQVGMLQVSAFQYQVVAKDRTDYREWLDDPDKMSEWFLAPLVDRLESSGQSLDPEQCYSFIQPLGLGGALIIENVMRIPIREHFGAWGQVFRQIRDLPDGSQVQFEIR